MSIYRLIVTGVLAHILGCVAAPQWTADKPLQARQQDVVECLALASQAAQGAGSWSSDRAIRAAVFENARDQYLGICLQSRGWYQRPSTSSPTSAPEPVRGYPCFSSVWAGGSRQFGALGWPRGMEDLPRGRKSGSAICAARVVETIHYRRQASIRLVLDRDSAAIQQRINSAHLHKLTSAHIRWIRRDRHGARKWK